MASLNMQVTKKLDSGYVQAEVVMPKGRNGVKFRVPEQVADDFCKELENNDKDARKKKNLFDFVMAPAIIIGSYILTGKTNMGYGLKFAVCTIPALITTHICDSKVLKNYLQKNDAVLKKYNAEEIDEKDVFDKTLK